ncbi:gas vesicle protein [Micromonospora coxensis]|uniref:gas vesicle protein n=1 Tax=Micromonospora coxensis TaxID=356852 RepID=UPI00342FE70B
MTSQLAPSTADDPLAYRPVALVDLLDRVLGTGVVITGDITLAIADVDLVRISLRALVASVGALVPPELRDSAAVAPDVVPPVGATSPGRPEAALPPGSVLPGSVLPGSVLPGSVLPGSVLPGSVLPGSVLPGSVLPGSGLPGEAG